MLFTIRGHRLYHRDKAVEFVPGQGGAGLLDPIFVIIRASSGLFVPSTSPTGANVSMPSPAHIYIHRSGSVTQFIPLNQPATQRQSSEWRGIANLESCTIVVEFENSGQLNFTADNQWVDWNGNNIDKDQILMIKNETTQDPEPWHIFPANQVRAGFAITNAIFKNYQIDEVLTHEQIARYSMPSPGPAFPIEPFRYLQR